MQATIIFRWRIPKDGHELEALKFADDSHAMWEGFVAQGLADGFEWFSNVTGTDHDMFIVRGEFATLMGLTATEQVQEKLFRGAMHLEGWHWDMAVAGATVDDVYPGWRAAMEAAAQAA